MSIHEKKYWVAGCDECEEGFDETGECDFTVYDKEEQVRNRLSDCDWMVIDGKVYCPECQEGLFCDKECEHLSITEEEQDVLHIVGKKPDHICNKYKTRVLHGEFHPKLVRLKECVKETK